MNFAFLTSESDPLAIRWGPFIAQTCLKRFPNNNSSPQSLPGFGCYSKMLAYQSSRESVLLSLPGLSLIYFHCFGNLKGKILLHWCSSFSRGERNAYYIYPMVNYLPKSINKSITQMMVWSFPVFHWSRLILLIQLLDQDRVGTECSSISLPWSDHPPQFPTSCQIEDI